MTPSDRGSRTSGPIGRRSFLRGAGVAVAVMHCGVAAADPPVVQSPLLFHSPPMRPFVDDMPLLPVVHGDHLNLAAASTTHRFHRDLGRSSAFGYGGMEYLGPTIEHRVDEPLRIHFTNRLGVHPFARDMDTSLHGVGESYRTSPPCSLHLHGGVTPPDSDGHPERLVFPGQSLLHHYPLRQYAAGLWYHDHAMGITRANVYAGLAGMVLLRDEFDTGEPGNPLGLPAGQFEIPMVLQEKTFTADGQQSLRTTEIVPQGLWEGGGAGDVGLVNGTVWPELEVARGLYRFRILNAASFSLWNLFFGNRMRFWVIGNDHGLLDRPVEVRDLLLEPGERVDLLVDFSGLAAGETVELRNDEPPVFQAAILGEVAMPLFCRFRVGNRRGFTGPVPQQLRGAAGLPAAMPALEAPVVVRNVTVSQPYAVRMPPAIMLLNNITFDNPAIEMPRQGTIEQWNIINITPDPHPIHIHLANFRIVGRTPLRTIDYQLADPQPPVEVKWTPPAENFLAGPEQPPGAWESGWKDIVRAEGGTVTRIIVRFPTAEELGFDPDATFPRSVSENDSPSAYSMPDGDELQGYVWHCHLLDHEDHEMMLRYRTVGG